MGIISFSDRPEEMWYVAGWAFRQILADILAQYSQDEAMADAFESADIHQGLLIKLLEPELAARVATAIRQVATGILSGAIRSGIHDQPYGDARTVEQYREALQELLATFPADRNNE